jgi:AcrR family transcriptional regulator
MTRPSDITRERILKAAQRLFADRGYKDTSVRAVVTRARVNQAAINYHFGGKDELYREVLRATLRALTEQQLAHAEEQRECPAKMHSLNSLSISYVRSRHGTSLADTSEYSIGKRSVPRPSTGN